MHAMYGKESILTVIAPPQPVSDDEIVKVLDKLLSSDQQHKEATHQKRDEQKADSLCMRILRGQ